MNPSKTLVLAILAAGAAPPPALAQTWPASVVAAAPSAAPAPSRSFVVLRPEEAGLRRLPTTPPTDPRTPRLSLKLAQDEDSIPDVELRPKAEWTDDQGFRISPTKLAFKRRF